MSRLSSTSVGSKRAMVSPSFTFSPAATHTSRTRRPAGRVKGLPSIGAMLALRSKLLVMTPRLGFTVFTRGMEAAEVPRAMRVSMSITANSTPMPARAAFWPGSSLKMAGKVSPLRLRLRFLPGLWVSRLSSIALLLQAAGLYAQLQVFLSEAEYERRRKQHHQACGKCYAKAGYVPCVYAG